jgi:hypothetical protein
MSISRKSFADKSFAGKFVASSRKGASSISSAALGLHMAEMQPSKPKSLRVAKHGPRLLELECTWVPSLFLGSTNQELSF